MKILSRLTENVNSNLFATRVIGENFFYLFSGRGRADLPLARVCYDLAQANSLNQSRSNSLSVLSDQGTLYRSFQDLSVSCPVHSFVMSTLCSTIIRSFSFRIVRGTQDITV